MFDLAISGKTYSYLLPTIQSLLQSKKEGYITRSQAPRIIVMAPTKFLAIQVFIILVLGIMS